MSTVHRLKHLAFWSPIVAVVALLWIFGGNANAAPFGPDPVQIIYDGGAVTTANALPVQGTITATVDTSLLATSANQTTANSSLSSISSNTGSGATASNQTSGNQKTKIVDISGNTAPAFDTASRAGFVKITDGTNTQPAGDTAARPIFVQVSNGSTADTTIATINTSLGLLTQPKSTTAVTISDSTDTTAYCGKGIWVGTAGDVAVKMLSDSAASTVKNVPSGTFVPGQFIRIMSTNTTASNIVCFGGTG